MNQARQANELIIRNAKEKIGGILKNLEDNLGMKVEGMKIKRVLHDQSTIPAPAPEIDQPTQKYEVYLLLLK